MLKALINAYRKHSIYRNTYNELSKLSEKELNDMGLSRSQISGLAYEVTYGKTA